MKLCTCFLLFRIFAYTISTPLNTPKEPKKGAYLYVFIATEEPVIAHHKIPQTEFRAPRVETFTDFIQGVANILNTYEDTAFANFFDILDKEIRKYHYEGCKFYELTENYEFRSQLAEKFDLIKRKSVPVLKADINEVGTERRHGTYCKKVEKLLEYINSLYREDYREKFLKVLSDLKAYGESTSERPKNYLVKIIRDGVRAIVFDHYTNLNINLRRALNKKIASFLKKIKAAPSSSSKTNLFPYWPVIRESENTVRISGYNIGIEDGNSEHNSEIHPTSNANTKDIETSKEENNRQHLQITYLSTGESLDETVEGNFKELSQERQRKNSQPYANLYTEDIWYKNTEKPEIIYKSDLKSKVVQTMLEEESTGRLRTVEPTPTPELSLMSDEDLRRSIAPPMPDEELSIEVFDRDRRKREKVFVRSNRIANRHETTSNEDTEAEPDKLRKTILSRINSRHLSDKDLRRSIVPPLPEEELSIDVFDRKERKRQKSLAKSNNIATVEHGTEDYIKIMSHVQNKLKQLNKIYENNRKSRMNGHKIKNVVDEYQAKKGKNKVRETKRDLKKEKTVNEDGQDIESNKEIVKNNDRRTHKLKNKKKATRSETTKTTKSTKTVKSLEIPVHRSLEPLPAANHTVNDNTKTSSTTTKEVGNATLNVTEEVKQKRIDNNATYDYAKKGETTRRHRRVLEFSSPPLYDQPFDDYTIQEGLHLAKRIN